MMIKRITALAMALFIMISISACTSNGRDSKAGGEVLNPDTVERIDTDKEGDSPGNNAASTSNAGAGANSEENIKEDPDANNEVNIQDGTEANTKDNTKANTVENTETNGHDGAESNTESNTRSNYEDNPDANIEANIETGTETDGSTAIDSNKDADTTAGAAGAAETAEVAGTAGATETAKGGDEGKVLEGRIICIDPGHQIRGNYDTEPVAPGSDDMKAKVSSGTAGVKTRIPEYKLNLEVSLKLRDALEKYGATVIMTRTENKVDISNAERAAIANDANADLYLRIHADGSTDKSVNGVSVLVPGKGHISDEYILKESEKAGSSILESFVEATGAKRRGLPERNDLSGFNWCKVPMALVEMGFMSNAEEDVKLNSSEYQDKMVEGMTDGIIEYFSNK